MTTKTARDVGAEIAYLTRALKAPSLRESVGRLAERARSESRSHEAYLAIVCNVRPPPGMRTAAKTESGPPASRPAIH